MPKSKAPWHVDVWDGQSGAELEIIDHGYCVEITDTVHGCSIRFTPDDALRLYSGLEVWLASKAKPITN